MQKLSLIILLFILCSACSRTVTRVDPSQQVDLSGRWNDTDSRTVADKMIYDLFDSEMFKNYAKQLGRKPVIVVGPIRNKT